MPAKTKKGIFRTGKLTTISGVENSYKFNYGVKTIRKNSKKWKNWKKKFDIRLRESVKYKYYDTVDTYGDMLKETRKLESKGISGLVQDIHKRKSAKQDIYDYNSYEIYIKK